VRNIREAIHHRLTQLAGGSADPPAHTVPSPDGRWIAQATLDPATDLLTWQVRAANDPDEPLEDIRDAYPTGIAWTPDGEGFFYDRVLPFSGGHGLYFHAVGTSQRQDACFLYRPEQSKWYYQPHVSPDGRWLAVSVLNGSAANLLFVGRTDSPTYAVVPRFVGRYDILHWRRDELICRAVEPDAPNGHLLAFGLPGGERTILLAESDLPLLDAAPLGDGWVASYLVRGSAELHWLDGTGKLRERLPLAGLGTVEWLESAQENATHHSATRNSQFATRFAYTDFARPLAVYTWQPGESTCTVEGDTPDLPFDPADFVIRSVTVPSTDGAPVPLFLAHRGDVIPADSPAILSAYGGLGHNLTPRFAADVLAWLEMGGLFVSVCARGGGELGAAWHQAAVGVHKQRTFDDVLAAASWLINQGMTTPSRLGLWGASNGGLTAGACLTQAPDRFGAVVIESGLLDMLDYPRRGRGQGWLAEYGDPDDPAQRTVLATYSPLHNVKERAYPASLITTSEHDPRVGEAHSLRFAQALVAAQCGPAPITLHVYPGSGHGDPPERVAWLDRATERLAFFAEHLGMGGSRD
jgi:prolyl oligopeptidase